MGEETKRRKTDYNQFGNCGGCLHCVHGPDVYSAYVPLHEQQQVIYDLIYQILKDLTDHIHDIGHQSALIIIYNPSMNI